MFLVGFDSALVRTSFQDSGSDTSLSDSRLSANYTFYQKAKWAVGLQGVLTLPTGKAADYLSDSSAGQELLVSVSKEWDPLSLTVNAGYLNSPGAQDSADPRLDYRKRIVTEIGAYHPFNDKMERQRRVSPLLDPSGQ